MREQLPQMIEHRAGVLQGAMHLRHEHRPMLLGQRFRLDRGGRDLGHCSVALDVGLWMTI